MIRGTIENVEREPVGLEDGGHILFQCSNCRAYLCDVWITKPEVGLKWRARARCCYCGDMSFEQSWQGLFALGGIGADGYGRLFLPGAGDESSGKSVTGIPDSQFKDDGLIIFLSKKVGNEAPVTQR